MARGAREEASVCGRLVVVGHARFVDVVKERYAWGLNKIQDRTHEWEFDSRHACMLRATTRNVAAGSYRLDVGV